MVETSYAEKRWGHGKLVRKLTRLRCRWRGHDWRRWAFDWPYDCPDLQIHDPEVNEELLWVRGCKHDCGAVQTTKCSLAQAGTLPGDRTALFDNPIRRQWR